MAWVGLVERDVCGTVCWPGFDVSPRARVDLVLARLWYRENGRPRWQILKKNVTSSSKNI